MDFSVLPQSWHVRIILFDRNLSFFLVLISLLSISFTVICMFLVDINLLVFVNYPKIDITHSYATLPDTLPISVQ